ncbi:hypothetical protein D3C76_1877530 [compost metagenome]
MAALSVPYCLQHCRNHGCEALQKTPLFIIKAVLERAVDIEYSDKLIILDQRDYDLAV